jgi:hypothetical protein
MNIRKAVLTTVSLLGAGAAVVAATGATAAMATDSYDTGKMTTLGQQDDGPRSGWHQVGSDMKSGISALAVTSHANGTYNALVARDNKAPGENRIARITFGSGRNDDPSTVQPLGWKGGAEPKDLEAMAAVPGTSGEYLAVASRGLVYRIKVTDDGKAVEVLDLSPLPAIGRGDDFESFALVSQHGKLAAVWADRGARKKRPATLYSAALSFNSYGTPEFGPVARAVYRAPYPTGNLRHASDLTITESGRLLITSAADEGDEGPFASALVDAGKVSLDKAGRVRLTVSKSPEILRKFEGRKVEAVDCLPGTRTALLGTDDEKKGGSAAAVARLCR